MTKTTIILLSGLFVVAVVGLFVVVSMSPTDETNGDDTTDAVATSSPDETADEATPYPNIDRINAKHFYAEGTHTFVGELAMPTPCDLLETSAEVRESLPEQVTLQFSVVNEADTCAQVITPQRFMIEVEASEEASFDAQFMGRAIDLNLIEPEPGETPDDFELYIKG